MGYESPDAYLLDLVADVLDEEPVDVIASIRAGFEDVRAGRTYPASKLDELLDSGEFDN